MTFSLPPQRAQPSISIPNTRFRRRAQLIATCLGVGGLTEPVTGPVRCGAPSGRHRLQREQLLTGPGAHGNAAGDRVPDQIIERASFGNVRKPRAVHVAFDQALLLQGASDALCDVFDEDLKVLWAGLWHRPEYRLPDLIDHVYAIQEQHVKVNVQVECGAEALNQRHCAGAARGAGECTH